MADTAPQLSETLDVNKAVSLSLGLASPLWFAFAGAAVAGSAFWWMSRWTNPANLEAILELPATGAPAAPAAKPDAVVEVVEPVAEIAATAAETVAEVVAAETAAMVEGLAEVDPVVDAPVAATVDDLTRLVGIGPKLAASLADLGVTSFAQIAAWTADDLAKFDTALSLKGRAARGAWVAQARRFADA
jgi:predicted flap endonuclease-1-like 5' DNA nuclease